MTGVLAHLAAVWWIVSLVTLLASFLSAFALPRLQRRRAVREDLPPVSAIVPIKLLDPDFEAAQEALFEQSYPELEILITSTDGESPAIEAAGRVHARHPEVKCRIVRSDARQAVSPKLNNLWVPIIRAEHDLILTKDSTIHLEPGDLESLVRNFVPGTGLVSTISIAAGARNLWAWIEASIINGYHARILMLGSCMGLGFGCGKIMLFRRSELERAGGLNSIAWALGEDAALAAVIERMGLRVVLADRVSRQILGSRRLVDVWHRQVRWMLIWRTQMPAIFAAELVGSAIVSSLAAALAAPLAGLNPIGAAAITLGTWYLVETALCLLKGWEVSLWSPFAFLGREILIFCARIRACTSNRVAWSGAVHSARRAGSAAGTVSEMPEQLRSRDQAR
jgi:ceramide glucosyltransferase